MRRAGQDGEVVHVLMADFVPLNVLYTFSLDAFYERSQHQTLVEAAVLQVRSDWAILHCFDGGFYVGDFGSPLLRMNKLNCTSGYPPSDQIGREQWRILPADI